VLAAVAAAVLVLAVVAARLLLGGGGPSAGPLNTRTTDSVAFGARVGVPFGWGTPVIWNAGEKTAVLDRVTVLDASPDLRVVATRIAGPHRKYLFFGESYRWPAPNKWFSDLHPVAGTQVAPAARDRPGQYGATRIAVDYHVGGTRHRVIVRSGLSVCPNAPPAPLRRDCPVVYLS
jgi:hypothetical protein